MKSLLSIIIILFITACNSTGTTTDTLTQNDPTASETPTEILTPKLYKISIKAGSVGTGTAAFGEFPLSIKVGDTVIWQNDDTLNHDFRIFKVMIFGVN
jgi:plastocyanin